MSATAQDQGIITCRFVWQAMETACPKCAELNGVEWTQDIYAPTLHDPFFGDVWDLDTDCSLAHPNCRCALLVSVEFNPDQWTELQDYKATLEAGFDVSVDTGDIGGIRAQLASLQADIEDTNVSMRMGEMTIIRFTYAMERLGVPKDMRQALTVFMRMIQTIRLLQISIQMLNAAEGPIGWLFAGISVAAMGMTAASAVAEIG